jgi:MFS family permease
MRSLDLLRSVVPTPVLKVGLVMSLALLGDSLIYVALPAHAAELALPLWAVGVLLGANRIVRLATNAIASGLFVRFGGRGPMVGAAVGSALTTATYGLVPLFGPLLVARMGWGACFSTVRLGAFTVVLAESERTSRGRMIGFYQSISRIGPVLALLLGGLAIEWRGYHATFVLLALATLPAVPLALSLPSGAYRPKVGPAGAGIEQPGAVPWSWRRRWLGGPRLLAVKIGMLGNGFASQGVVISSVALAIAEVSGTTEGAAALAGLLVASRWGLDLALAAPLGHLSDRFGRARVIPALLFVEALAMVLMALAGNRTGIVLATLAVFLLSTALTAASDAAAGDLAPVHRRAEVMSGYADWIDIGAALGPPLAFALAGQLGLRGAYGLTAMLLLGAGLQFVVGWRPGTASPEAEPVEGK